MNENPGPCSNILVSLGRFLSRNVEYESEPRQWINRPTTARRPLVVWCSFPDPMNERRKRTRDSVKQDGNTEQVKEQTRTMRMKRSSKLINSAVWPRPHPNVHTLVEGATAQNRCSRADKIRNLSTKQPLFPIERIRSQPKRSLRKHGSQKADPEICTSEKPSQIPSKEAI